MALYKNTMKSFSLSNIRERFPIFSQHPGLVYLDNAATTQRVDTMIEAMDTFYHKQNATVHRGVYELSATASQSFEACRTKVADFIGAPSPGNIAFTKGTTESINIVASSFLRRKLRPGDNVVVSIMEHHANFIPWQMLCREVGAELRIIPISGNGDLDLGALEPLLDNRTRLVAITHISNLLGTFNPIEEVIALAHAKGVPVLIDAAQSGALYPMDVTQMDCDFLTFSGHKAFGPFGIGVLYTRQELKADIHPYTYGGGIVQNVMLDVTDFKPYPHNLDAGTPNIPGVIGLSAAIDFTRDLDRKACVEHVQGLSHLCRNELKRINGVKVLGEPLKTGGIVSFYIDDIHPHDVASFLDEDHIAVRAGVHCAQPLLDHLDVAATVRASFSIYNTKEEVEHLVHAVKELIKFWR